MRCTCFVLGLVVVLVLMGCSKEDADSAKEQGPEAGELITIPVVVHIVNYAPNPFDISDEDVAKQLAILNQDFNKSNPDWVKTPEMFKDLVANVGIRFELATKGPKGNATSGIIRTSGDVTGFEGNDTAIPVTEKKLFFTELGGQDAWDRNRYLNIWVADLNDRHGKLGLAGYAYAPGADPREDGVVIGSKAFGTLGDLAPAHRYGRTATHEIGHWLGLKHVYGDSHECGSSDGVADTPEQQTNYRGKPSFPKTSCGSQDMFMNYMDNVDDDAMYMFTKGQGGLMRSQFQIGSARHALFLNNKSLQ